MHCKIIFKYLINLLLFSIIFICPYGGGYTVAPFPPSYYHKDNISHKELIMYIYSCKCNAIIFVDYEINKCKACRGLNINFKSYETYLNYKIAFTLRQRISNAIKKKIEYKELCSLLNCTIKNLRKYLSSKFKPGMTWENYGITGWHIDHIKPCAMFNLSDIEQKKECFHYTNLQPLWAIDNIKKSSIYKGKKYFYDK